MKKFSIFIFILFLVGCENNYERKGSIESKSKIPGSLKRIKIEGHTFLYWHAAYAGSLTHWPDCECGNKD